jgi:hypothetical protein
MVAEAGFKSRYLQLLIKELLVHEALSDAKLKYDQIEQAAVSYLYGGTCCGQRVFL